MGYILIVNPVQFRQVHQLFEVKVFEPAEDGLFVHPARIRLTNCFQASPIGSDGVQWLRQGVYQYPFVNGKCKEFFLGNRYCQAQIVEPIDPSRSMEPDRFAHWDEECEQLFEDYMERIAH